MRNLIEGFLLVIILLVLYVRDSIVPILNVIEVIIEVLFVLAIIIYFILKKKCDEEDDDEKAWKKN